MSVGLWDAVHLTNALGGGAWSPIPDDAPKSGSVNLLQWERAVRPALRAWHWRRKGLSSVINILAQALYSLFGADDENLEVLREGCFKYFERGGECVGGPVRLLSGLAPQPMLLFYHFFSVALYSIWCLFTHPAQPKAGDTTPPTPPSVAQYPALLVRSVRVFYTACIVLLPVVFTEMRSNIPRFGAAPQAVAALTSRKKSGAGSSSSSFATALADRTTLLTLSAAAVLAWVYMGHAGNAHAPLGAPALGQRFAGAAASHKSFSDWLTFPRALAQQ